MQRHPPHVLSVARQPDGRAERPVRDLLPDHRRPAAEPPLDGRLRGRRGPHRDREHRPRPARRDRRAARPRAGRGRAWSARRTVPAQPAAQRLHGAAAQAGDDDRDRRRGRVRRPPVRGDQDPPASAARRGVLVAVPSQGPRADRGHAVRGQGRQRDGSIRRLPVRRRGRRGGQDRAGRADPVGPPVGPEHGDRRSQRLADGLGPADDPRAVRAAALGPGRDADRRHRDVARSDRRAGRQPRRQAGPSPRAGGRGRPRGGVRRGLDGPHVRRVLGRPRCADGDVQQRVARAADPGRPPAADLAARQHRRGRLPQAADRQRDRRELRRSAAVTDAFIDRRVAQRRIAELTGHSWRRELLGGALRVGQGQLRRVFEA